MAEEKKENVVPQGAPVKKRIVIETDGNSWQITKETTCSPLEMKEICREILLRLGA